MTQNNKNWIKDNTFGLISVAITVLTVFYYGVVKDNDDHNLVIEAHKRLDKLDVLAKGLEDKKVDKEVFYIIQTTLADIKADLREVRDNQTNKR